jgi:2-keto-4-pentenoate hydratase/2-oxohepta-3-ene-1,7-dioic acid hydratase in catechol pathway
MKIFCVGRNYGEHAKELGNTVPEEPVIFMKPETAILKNHHEFHYPNFTNDLHYETELVLHIGKEGKNISEENAIKYCNKITVGIDFTARDVQNELKKKGLPWEKAKAWNDSAVLGKWLELNNSIYNHSIHFSLNKNKSLVQQGNSRDMIFSFNKIVSHISEYFLLEEGDVIFTGTPAGVAACNIGDMLEGFFENEKVFEVKIIY